ncbi:MAG: ABC transporter permease [Actinobacteria bacterium]|nr:ABC transporter permease [Actinomycetota bacterium]
MTTTPATVPFEPLAPGPGDRSRLSWALADTAVVAKRNLLRYVRVPSLLVFTFVQPIMFTLLFRYVFGGAIPLPGNIPYVNYLLPGIFVQTVLFGSTATGVGLAEDMSAGLVDRFRSLPMARMAVLAGRTLADLVRNFVVVVLMAAVGFLVGFRPHGGVGGFLAAVAIVLAVAFAFSWIFAIVGLGSPTAEAAQAVSFPLIFPLTFASSAFVPTSGMPGPLRAFADNQPITLVINAVRRLMLGGVDSAPLHRAGLLPGSTATAALQAVVWIGAILVVAAPLAVARFRRTV